MYLPGQFFSESPHFPNLLVDEGVEQHQHQQGEHVHEDGIHPGDIHLVSMDRMMQCSNPESLPGHSFGSASALSEQYQQMQMNLCKCRKSPKTLAGCILIKWDTQDITIHNNSNLLIAEQS